MPGFPAAAGMAVPAARTGGISTVHFRPEAGVLGDVIPFYWRGTYHVFYLKGSAWGHIACEDLVHWRQLPDALSKGEGATAPDGENCWTGSIVEDSGAFHLFYTGKNSRDPKGDQKVMHAVSRNLTAWTKLPGQTFYADGVNYWSKPVNGGIDDRLIYHHQAFRDPEVVRMQREGKWWLLLHAALPDGSSPAFARYESADLMRWTPCKPLVVLPKTLSADCPHLFEAQGKWYLLAADRHYTSAASPEGPFPSEMMPYDCGELFVPKTMHDGHQRILLGWIGDREGGKDAGKGVWGGILCMPRELYADDRGRLCQRPAAKVVEAYNKTVVRLDDGPQPGKSVDVPPNYMMHCRITAAAPNTEAVVVMRAAPDNPEAGYRLKIRFGDRKVSLGDPYRTYDRDCDFDAGAPVDVRVFLAGTVIECFLNDAYCFTMRVYDAANGELRIDAAPGGLAIADFEVKTLPE
jgi:beta-fructofuranosidase